jgi:hypothetical protein
MSLRLAHRRHVLTRANVAPIAERMLGALFLRFKTDFTTLFSRRR